MTGDRHIIWSNYDLDYENWRDDLETEYPDMTEDERIALMYEINGDYLDDERMNLDRCFDFTGQIPFGRRSRGYG